jgi:hypothetical protein
MVDEGRLRFGRAFHGVRRISSCNDSTLEDASWWIAPRLQVQQCGTRKHDRDTVHKAGSRFSTTRSSVPIQVSTVRATNGSDSETKGRRGQRLMPHSSRAQHQRDLPYRTVNDPDSPLHTNVGNSDSCIRDFNLTNRAMSSQCFLKAPFGAYAFTRTSAIFVRLALLPPVWTMALPGCTSG